MADRDPMPSQRALFALPPDMLYLDSAAHGPPVRAVREAGIAAIARSTTSWFGGAGWRDDVERVRALATRLFEGDGGRDADDAALAIVPSAAYGMSVAARNVPLAAGEAVLVLDGQFPSSVLPWAQRCRDTGARLRTLRREPGQDWTDAVLAGLDADPAVGVLVLPQVHWHDGALLDLDRIAPLARARGARLVLDLSQSLGVLPPRLAAWQPEFVVAVGYKWLLGGYGLAWLWAAPHWRDRGQPLEQGWMAHDRDALWAGAPIEAATPLPGARRYDAGGVCDAPRLAMAEAGLRQLLDWDVATLAPALQARTDALADALQAAGLGALCIAGHGPHLCALHPPTDRLEALATALRTQGVVFSVRGDGLRIAPHLHVAVAEMARFAGLVAAAL